MTGAGPLWLHVFATFGRGGPQVRTTQLLARLPGRHAVLAMDGRTEAAALVPPGVDLELLTAPPRRGFLANVHALGARMASLRPRLVLTYNWGAIEAAAAARRRRLPLVHHEEGFGEEEQVRRLRRRNWIRRVVLRGVPVIVPSARLLTIARREWWLGANCHHLPNGVDVARFRPAVGGPDRGAGGGSRPFTIGSVGGLRGEKDHATLLLALAKMRTADARLVLVGDGPERERLQELARRSGVAHRVTFAGATDDTAPLYRGFDGFALSSRTEQMPLSVLEAMASGLPVASTDVGDVAAMLPAECRGAIAPAGDAAALAAALDALAADPDRRIREGARNRAHCAQHFELASCLDRFVACYESAVAGR